MSAQQPIVIRGRGTTTAVGTWLCALSLAGFLLIAAMNAHRSAGGALLAAAVAAYFGAMLLYISTLRVELNGDEVSYQHISKRRRSLRLDQISSARGVLRTSKSGRFGSHLLLIEPIDPATPVLKIRLDLFAHADVQAIRSFFGDKLKRHTKR
jgi:hypothetical protein